MDSPVRRRRLLRAGMAALATAGAGCNRNTADGPSPEPSGSEPRGPESRKPGARTDTESPAAPTATPPELPFDVPSREDCVVPRRPRPTPGAGFQPREYPQYASPPDATSAAAYAAAYEEAYRFNSYLDSEANADTRQLTVDADAEDRITEETTDGFLVGVEGELSVMQDGIIEDNPVVGVYYLGPGVGLRGEIREPTLYEVETLRSITVERSRALYCQGSRDEGPESDRGST